MATTERIKHKNGKVGGYLIGRRHTKGGIKAVNTDNDAPLEVESDEVIITRKAVLSDEIHEFDGQLMTNLEIYDATNRKAGGVGLLEQGGKIEENYACKVCGSRHTYDGQDMTDREILAKMEAGGYMQKMDIGKIADEIEAKLREAGVKFGYNQAMSGTVYFSTAAGQIRVADHPENTHAANRLPAKWDISSVKEVEMIIPEILAKQKKDEDRDSQIKVGTILAHPGGYGLPVEVIEIPTVRYDHGDIRVKRLKDGYEYITYKSYFEIAPGQEQFKAGGHTCACNHSETSHKLPHDLLPYQHPDQFKKGGIIKKPKEPLPADGIGIFKGIDFHYENPYELNRAIEALLDSRPEGDFDVNEKRFLKYYSGYGGLQKYGASGVGILYEYFTPGEIAKRMWGLAYKYGYQGESVLEPSCGTGEFFNYAPDNSLKMGYEINPYSARIAKILHPTVNLEIKHFEEIFIRNRDTIRNKIDGLPKYDLVIGNPPYGDFQGKFAGLGEKVYTRASNYVDYFIFRGLDLLNSGGLLIYVIGVEVAAGGVPFLAQNMTPVKREIAEKSQLLDAYRLPNGVFDRTDVLTDIIVLKKK
jgi:hypothetical protein